MIMTIMMFSIFHAFQKQDASSTQQEMWTNNIYEHRIDVSTINDHLNSNRQCTWLELVWKKAENWKSIEQQ